MINTADSIKSKYREKILGRMGRCGLEVKRAPGNQGVRGSNPAYSSIFRGNGNGNESQSILSIAESGSVAKRKKSGKRNTYTYTYMERRR